MVDRQLPVIFGDVIPNEFLGQIDRSFGNSVSRTILNGFLLNAVIDKFTCGQLLCGVGIAICRTSYSQKQPIQTAALEKK
jgi:hypothetical protein